MTPQEQQERLRDFVNSFPTEVHNELGRKDLDIVVTVLRICGEREWVLYETGGVCDGVRRILAGEISPAELAGIISRDANIEEDNRVEIPELAMDIQTRVFDIALPILKAAGYPTKEGRVQTPPPKAVESPYAPVPSPLAPGSSSFPKGGAASGGFLTDKNPSPPSAVLPLGKGESYKPGDDKYVRALARIAAGTTYSEQQLMESFEGLPLGLRQAIASVDTANAVQTIAKKNLLHVDQMAALASETGLVLLGLTHPRDYIANLGKRLRVPEAKARDIAKEISGEVLSKVRDSLRTLHESPGTPKPVPQPPSQTQVPKPQVQPVVPESKLGILTEQAKAGLSTPYTPDAAWKTSAPPSPSSGSSLTAKSYQLKADAIGPTGWRPGGPRRTTPSSPPKPVPVPVTVQPPSTLPATAPIQASASSASAPRPPAPPQPARQNPPQAMPPMSTAPVPHPPRVFRARTPGTIPAVTVSVPRPPAPTPAASASVRSPQPVNVPKVRPASDGSAPSAPKPPSPDDFLTEKMQAPMGIPREEKKYTVDPYREPLE